MTACTEQISVVSRRADRYCLRRLLVEIKKPVHERFQLISSKVDFIVDDDVMCGFRLSRG